MGGEITWECLANGNYRFILKLYRECNGINYYHVTSLHITNNPPSDSVITMSLVSQKDISPVCNPNPAYEHIYCYPKPTSANTGAVEEWIYTSDSAYSNGVPLSGVPPSGGWIISHTEWGMDRNPCTNIMGAESINWYLRAIMYPYKGQNVNPCFDNSPTFAERPSTVICTGYPFTYNHNAWDKELDSLTYAWAPPLEPNSTYFPPYTSYPSNGIPITAWNTGYSYSSPLPGTSFNPNNVPATVNLHTGEISFTSYTQGAFVTVSKVTAYKCGIKVAEIFREMQVVLLACGSDFPPVVTAPFKDPNTGLSTLYIDTVHAGDLVNFTMSATDVETLPNGDAQTLHLFASGSQFGTNCSSSTTGCLNPPCATLSPPPLPDPVGLAGVTNVQTTFNWQTDCDHLATPIGCTTTSNVYNFIIKVQDDFCPAPAIAWKTITVVVIPPVWPPPDPRCASVDANGDVTLTWILPVDSVCLSDFDGFFIYSSTSPSGPFTLIDSVLNISQTSYTHTGANANTQSIYYYIKVRSKTTFSNSIFYSEPSDTIQTILLNATNSGTGTASLSWNPIHNPNLSTSLGWYHIYKEYPPGTWMLVDSTQSLSYSDTITLCNAQINYYVEIFDSLGCSSVSSIGGDVFQDGTAPPCPLIDSVSVDSITGRSVIGWLPSSSPDTKGYIIYENKNSIWVPVDTIPDINTTFYTNANPYWSNPDSCSLSYCLAAFDSCRNTSPLGISHSTIFLTSVPDVCGGSVTLNWTPYINMHPGLMGYRISVRENNGVITLLGTNPGTNQSFVHSPLTQLSEYIYSVQAFDSSGTVTSTSNTDTVIAYTPLRPQFIYLRYATVVNNDHARIKCLVDTVAFVSKYKIMRSDFTAGPYIQIGTVNPNPTPFITYNDYTAYVNDKSYYYKVIAVDSCGNDAATSNIGRTIYLQATASSDMRNFLSWNSYESWPGGVDTYNLYRKVEDVWGMLPLATLTSADTTYIDDVSSYTNTNGKFGYLVEALEGTGNPYLFTDTSLSNEVIALQPPRFYVPNAFVPKGMNNIFIPQNVFVDAEDYQLSIYNRWGEMIFETADTKAGWDGTVNGTLAQQDVYVYCIRYKNSQNKYIEKRGTVTLLK